MAVGWIEMSRIQEVYLKSFNKFVVRSNHTLGKIEINYCRRRHQVTNKRGKVEGRNLKDLFF